MIVSIDAASTDLSVALARPDGTPIAEASWTSAQRQSAELLPRLLALLAGQGRAMRETSAIAVGTGPGSFTGLRVAMALAKGLAVGLNRPIVGVPSLAAWLESDPETDAALTRAGAREAYLQLRDAEGPVLVDRDALPHSLGSAAVVAPGELADAFGLQDARRPRGAPAIAARAAARLAIDARGDDVRSLEPIYLRAPRGVSAESEGRVRWL